MVYSCKEDEEPEPQGGGNTPQELCDSLDITFDTHIKAIVDNSCNGATCHAPGGGGGFSLQTYDEVKGAAQYPAFLGAIMQMDTFTFMPYTPAPKLSDALIEQLECWEKSGFPEN